jgi:hypothetical protein
MTSANTNSYFIQSRVGRLIEARVFALSTAAEARAYCGEFRAAAARLPSQLIVCADYRPVAVYGPEVADELKALMISFNARVLRSALLVHPAHATGAMQVSRLAAESGHEARRRFTAPAELLAWLAAVTTPEEQQRAQVFLAEWWGSPPAR